MTAKKNIHQQAQPPKRMRWLMGKIVINIAPLLITGFTAWVLLSSLGTDRHFGRIPLNAFQWPGYASMADKETNSVASSAEKLDSETLSPSKPTLQSKVIHGILVFTTYMFVACNTLIFLIENLIAFSRVKHKLLYLAWALTFFVWLPTVFWLPKVYYHWDAQWIATYPDEVVALWIFVIFLIVDWINYRVYASGGRLHDAIDSRFAISQAAFVDFPVIAGIGISILLAKNFSQYFGNSEEQYIFGFFSGAAVMHLATSQIIYTILAIRRDVLKRKQPSD
jgi:hypothetical protein